jgi:hypothetical protein
MSRKEALIRMHAARRGLHLIELLPRAKCTRSVFYRIIKGTGVSARIDRVLCRALEIKSEELRRAACEKN